MKPNCREKALKFGGFIADVYNICGIQKAKGIVPLTTAAHPVDFRGQPRFVIFENFNLGAQI
jgi:hypothetical protein